MWKRQRDGGRVVEGRTVECLGGGVHRREGSNVRTSKLQKKRKLPNICSCSLSEF